MFQSSKRRPQELPPALMGVKGFSLCPRSTQGIPSPFRGTEGSAGWAPDSCCHPGAENSPKTPPGLLETTSIAALRNPSVSSEGNQAAKRPKSRPGAPKIGVFSLLHPTEGEMLAQPVGAAAAAEQMLPRTREAGSGDLLSRLSPGQLTQELIPAPAQGPPHLGKRRRCRYGRWN